MRLSFLTIWLSSLVLISCSSNPPVQEMSNARQTIQAAHDVQANVYAPQAIRDAESLLEQATRALEAGDYQGARESAIAAQQQAIKARQQALSKNRDTSR